METLHYAIASGDNGVKYAVWTDAARTAENMKALHGLGDQGTVYLAQSRPAAMDVLAQLGANLVDHSVGPSASGPSGPQVSSDGASGKTPCSETRPVLGLSPTQPL